MRVDYTVTKTHTLHIPIERRMAKSHNHDNGDMFGIVTSDLPIEPTVSQATEGSPFP
jgi:hypothetical protein